MEETKLTTEEKKELMAIARKSVAKKLEGRDFNPSSDLEGLQQKAGAFVTIHKEGALRGCIGNFISNAPLYQTVSEMALSAAFKDPRFTPLKIKELNKIDFEISVLSPLREITDISEIEVGKHGIYITKDYDRGVLLPQVATEYGWDRETFLSHTCTKAGLAENEWKKDVKIEIFSAQIFGEKEN